MGARIIDGKAIAAELREGITDRVVRLSRATGRPPGLAVIRVGEDPASRVYVTKKRQDCAQVGIRSFNHDLPEQTSESALLELLARLNEDPAVDGTLVQLPLPQHMDPQKVIAAIDPDKDVDGFHPTNVGRLTLRLPGLRSCTPRGVMTLLEHTGIPLEGRDAVIVGQSNIVGRPMALELLNARCTVTICHSRTRELEAKVRGADVLVAAVGREAFIPGAWIKSGATVIDVGINRNADGKLVGDVDFAGAAEQAAWITPVPGGVGPMTRASLLANTLQAHEAREGLT